MKERAIQLYRVMQNDLAECVSRKLLPITELECCFQVCSNYWEKIKHKVIAHSFSSEMDEILFFKMMKPLFTSEIEYYGLLCHAQLFKDSTTDIEDLRQFWLREIMRLEKFINENCSFYNYYKNGNDENDISWFTRANNDGSNFLKAKSHDLDSGAATSHDYLISTLLALEKYNKYAEEEYKLMLIKHG
ncbi:MAG: RteC domain-containing protein [Bacteroidota bacterium]